MNATARTMLTMLFTLILGMMFLVTVRASLAENLMTAGKRLGPDLWFQATLCDAYCGFFIFYAWVAYKETRWAAKVGWLVAILFLGNLAMATYGLLQLRKAKPFSAESLLLRSNSR